MVELGVCLTRPELDELLEQVLEDESAAAVQDLREREEIAIDALDLVDE